MNAQRALGKPRRRRHDHPKSPRRPTAPVRTDGRDPSPPRAIAARKARKPPPTASGKNRLDPARSGNKAPGAASPGRICLQGGARGRSARRTALAPAARRRSRAPCIGAFSPTIPI